jgi:hypothetical protein
MKIGFYYRAYEDCVAILYSLTNSPFKVIGGEFEFEYNGHTLFFTKDVDKLKKSNSFDLKIGLFHTFHEWKSPLFEGFDKLIQTQTVENYHVMDYELQEYLDAGNIAISAGSIFFKHPNFFYDPLINLIFFYYHYGFNFLNYYDFGTKKNLLGIYFNPKNNINIFKEKRDKIYNKVSQILDKDFVSYNVESYNLKHVLQSYTTFGHWGNNHISSYTDYMTSVVNIVFETLHDDSNEFMENDNRMYRRFYITEKTLKSIIYTQANTFFIWYGSNTMFRWLREMGFWFLNLEFYTNDLENSVIKTAEYLKELNEKYSGDKQKIYDELKSLYGHHNENNVNIFKKMLNEYDRKDELLNLIINGNGN